MITIHKLAWVLLAFIESGDLKIHAIGRRYEGMFKAKINKNIKIYGMPHRFAAVGFSMAAARNKIIFFRAYEWTQFRTTEIGRWYKKQAAIKSRKKTWLVPVSVPQT